MAKTKRTCKLCDDKAIYGLKNSFDPTHCKTHGLEIGLMDATRRLCSVEECSKRLWEGHKGTEFCCNHDLDGIVLQYMDAMVDKIEFRFSPDNYKFCRHPECSLDKRASYGVEKNKPMYCKPHADLDLHHDVVHDMCITCGVVRAAFGPSGGKRMYCASCNPDTSGFKNHDTVWCKVCEAVSASYGKEGTKKPTHCSPCGKEAGLVRVVGKTCLLCKTQPSYGYIGESTVIYCARHAREHPDWSIMSPNKKITCLTPDCQSGPTYGYECDRKAIYCAYCKDRHIDKEILKDVKNAMCVNCKEHRPTYGIERATHCATCADKSIMSDQRHDMCIVPDCGTRSTFGYESKKPLYCLEHSIGKNCEDVMNPRCQECNITTENRNYKPYCSSCYYNLNPEEERSINFKTKELAFTRALYPDLILDRVIQGGTSRYRPDALLRLPTHSIIIEIDEAQHLSYCNNAESMRLAAIRRDLNDVPLIVIRLNPDGYNDGVKRVEGCFSRSKGALIRKEKEYKRRLYALQEALDNAINVENHTGLSVVPLFFDTTVDNVGEAMSNLAL
jgi:hypothetical protein